MLYGGSPYGSTEYAGLSGVTITGTCSTVSSGESCLCIGSIPVEIVSGGNPIYGLNPPRAKKPKAIKGKCFTESNACETFAFGEVEIVGVSETHSSKSKARAKAALIFDGRAETTSQIGNRKATGELIFSGTCESVQAQNESHVLAAQQFEATARTKQSSTVGGAGSLVFIGMAASESPDHECEAVGAVAPRIIGSGSTSYPSGETKAQGKIQYAYRGRAITQGETAQAYGHGFAEDVNARDEEEFLQTIIGML